MIKNEDLYNIALNIARKDTKGRAFTVKEFNRYLWDISYEYFYDQYKLWKKKKQLPPPLEVHRGRNETINVVMGTGTLPADYYDLLSRPKWGMIPVSVLSDEAYDMKVNNALMAPSALRPSAKIYLNALASGWNIAMYPAATFGGIAASVVIDYLKTPVVPILDYYINPSGAYVFLDEDATHVAVAGETYPLADVQPVAGATYTSTTQEMRWDDTDKTVILYFILSRAGVTIEKESLVGYFNTFMALAMEEQNRQ